MREKIKKITVLALSVYILLIPGLGHRNLKKLKNFFEGTCFLIMYHFKKIFRNIFKVLVLSTYILKTLKYLMCLLPNYIPKEGQSIEKGAFFNINFGKIKTLTFYFCKF